MASPSLEQLLLLTSSWTGLALIAASLSIAYWISLAIYRLYLSPLSSFPGPKLAALTTSYQAYHDLYLGGQWFKKLEVLHKQYGPIVRVNPHELHVIDPEFIDILYTGSSQKREKYKWIGRSLLLPASIVATIPHDLHRRRRAALNPFFSKEKVRRLEPAIRRATHNLLERMQRVAEEGGVMNLSLVYRALTSDLISGYCFGRSTEYLQRENYNEPFFRAVDENLKMAWPMTYISWLGPLMAAIPPRLMGVLHPGLKSMWEMHESWTRQIEEIRHSKDLKDNSSTIFHGLLNSSLPDEDKSPDRLRQEAKLLILAGMDTTAYILSALTFELLANPDKLSKLRTELLTTFPTADSITGAIASQLPYLTAVIQEALRLHPGALTRMTRVAPEQTMVYHDRAAGREWRIPPGTPVTMTALPVQMDASIFTDPYKFEPERWLENPRLDRYLLAFSKGSRSCIGFELAYAELYIVIANVFWRYERFDGKEGTGGQKSPTVALHDTVRERDIDPVRDLLVPYPAVGSKGVRVRLRA